MRSHFDPTSATSELPSSQSCPVCAVRPGHWAVAPLQGSVPNRASVAEQRSIEVK
ncbi:hypothetical protein FOQG_03663 [Fusarium oxysporum f. sp. raphani 54005]|uniref:Uncharacterized protein n=8 Tax=Fusarium oxysporum TaxID=5507 RepID=W9I0Z7_FUSOX|nr:hypothetical protein FOXG_20055 [Fusarium oxysporum f. sp. lycopersici 4287]EWY86684.1 hypothetical protein FOYG_11114 [Fusarium oxysporum NRRL 32931]EWZ35005.1 hypothetical protein FOZG_12773 [Fusarium oxysporum Fo47]EXA38967.1 hypothetical protein FOVG_10700 [Fusarium oxysporum f. sp. pisi HDV247]EXK37660.1 hypothetical protein FOMG_08307 [Fusarium oxysporum f. sp. melonis 26406]EXK94876.1 hypothetical protein FOQG_03663 [Fusarium oxysporum f. sp. raphani 54005]EXL48723.1 hypothetical pr